MSVQIAPLSFAFETIAANERMNTIMNHELVHVATMDRRRAPTASSARLFAGKVAPSRRAARDHPLHVPDLARGWPRRAGTSRGAPSSSTPGWRGASGRAQSPYDEMVFRSMVRDQSRFYDPLGLVSEGIKVDFQLQINSYLYGTRFMSYLALQHSPEHADPVARRARTAAGPTTPPSSRTSSAGPPRRRLARLDRVGAGLPAGEPRGDPRSTPRRRTRTSPAGRSGSVSRAFLDRDAGEALRGVQLSGHRRPPGGHLPRGRVRARSSWTSRARRSTRSPPSPTTRRAARSSTQPTTTPIATCVAP